MNNSFRHRLHLVCDSLRWSRDDEDRRMAYFFRSFVSSFVWIYWWHFYVSRSSFAVCVCCVSHRVFDRMETLEEKVKNPALGSRNDEQHVGAGARASLRNSICCLLHSNRRPLSSTRSAFMRCWRDAGTAMPHNGEWSDNYSIGSYELLVFFAHRPSYGLQVGPNGKMDKFLIAFQCSSAMNQFFVKLYFDSRRSQDGFESVVKSKRILPQFQRARRPTTV